MSFHGVRGSTPCSCPTVQKYGGNTSCVSIEADGQETIVLDLGTGLRPWGCSLPTDRGMTLHALVTHLHWDHVQGLPFFTPLQHPDTTLHVYGPGDEDDTMAESFGRFMAPPFFPIRTTDLPSTIKFHDTQRDDLIIDGAKVMVRPVPHTGPTNGYRVTINDVSIAYIPDHQEPIGRPQDVDEAVLELCDGVDLLIHDAQLWADELPAKATWGHCTPEYALEVAKQAGARSLMMFHHDPGHTDTDLDEMTQRMGELGADAGVRCVVSATDGLKVPLSAEL